MPPQITFYSLSPHAFDRSNSSVETPITFSIAT